MLHTTIGTRPERHGGVAYLLRITPHLICLAWLSPAGDRRASLHQTRRGGGLTCWSSGFAFQTAKRFSGEVIFNKK